MSGPDLLFWIFSAMMLFCGVLVVFSVNPVSSAMFLVLMFFFMAGLYVLLQAYFLAIIQILVYAGAVMVLFLFVIMLLGVKEPRRWWYKNRIGLIGGPLALAGVAALLGRVLGSANWVESPAGEFQATVRDVVTPLFRDYALPFEVIALLLLVATVGVVLLGKKEQGS